MATGGCDLFPYCSTEAVYPCSTAGGGLSDSGEGGQ